ncbi:MAG: GreA/GreB family elongation factor [Sciscionella sp.]
MRNQPANSGVTGQTRTRVERELAVLQDQRRELATRLAGQDPVGDRADEADALTRGDELAAVDDRIASLRELLDASAADPNRTDADSDGLVDGTRVTLRFPDGALRTLRVVTITEEAAEAERDTVLTTDSPLGNALAGHHPGDLITYPTPAGKQRVELVSLTPPSPDGRQPGN